MGRGREVLCYMPTDRMNETASDKKKVAGVRQDVVGSPVSNQSQILLKDLYHLSGKDVLNRILDHESPSELVRALPYEDFFWIIKKVGEEDCLPVLQLASTDQWEFLLDLDVWERDQLDLDTTSAWLKRLQEADCGRLVKWLISKGASLAYFYSFKSLDVIVVSDKDEVYDIPEEFFSFDGVVHIRVRSQENRESLENIFRTMAATDFDRYQALMLGLMGVLPAEMEEEIYRLRNVRLAEHGFLPREEAIAVYAPLDPKALRIRNEKPLSEPIPDEESLGLIPVLPLEHAGKQNMLAEVISGISDPILLDRIRLEFAGLCNQILSADGLLVRELDVLLRTCRKASGYLSLALESLCGRDAAKTREIVRNHSLVSLFRVGFGLALKLKWEAERWVKGSWFHARGLDWDFWGDHWGGILTGLMLKRPMYYSGPHKGDAYKDFEWLSEVTDCTVILRHLMVLDGLMERLSGRYSLSEGPATSPKRTYQLLLFNLWSRLSLGLEPSFSGLSLEQAKAFFRKLRTGEASPPYRMSGFREVFVHDFAAFTSDSPPETLSVLEEALSIIWQEFGKEYEWVSIEDLDSRYSPFLTINQAR